MERRAQFNLAYLLFALIAMLAVQQWWQRSQTVEVVPYSEFEKLLAEHRIDEVVISDQRITGKLKSAEGGKTVAVANLVPPDLAERLSKYDVKYTRVYESTFLRDLLSWILPALIFVGVGAGRVRDLFEQARQKAPAIIFIDELDALGRARGASGFGGHDEKEQTLNQLLVEMDGFDPSSGLVLIAATNRPEILDPALLRAGRFDRVVLVDRPAREGRLQILQVHARKIRLGPDVDLEKVAALTPGFSGADLANLVNEAALLATRRGADAVTLEDFNQAIERMVAGLEKKNRVLNETERRVVAHHEMGHAMVAMALPGTDPVHKISIIPRGVGALGYTIQRPTEDRFLMTRSELENKMAVLLGGRAAEEGIFGHQSTGGANDLAKVTDIARSMVMRYAMVESLGHIAYEERSEEHTSELQSLT